MKKVFALNICILLMMICSSAYAAKAIIPMYLVNANGASKPIGNVTFDDTRFGMLITPQLRSLPLGLHGFHVHENPTCLNNAMAAGGHLDPQKTGKHLGPYNNFGHYGDLPALYVNEEGVAVLQTLAPRMQVKDLYGHAIVIHASGDNYSDVPEKMGGGGARIACGVLAAKTILPDAAAPAKE